MENNITLSLGGEERTLVFGKAGFLRHVGELTKPENFDILEAALQKDPLTAYWCTYYFIHAGLLCANHKNLEKDKILEWVDELPTEKIEEIQWLGYSAITGKSVEDLKRQIEEASKKNGLAKQTVY